MVTLGAVTLDKTPEIQYNLICANIIAQVIVSIMPDIAVRLAPDGNAILSGIIEERLPDIYAALDTQLSSLFRLSCYMCWRKKTKIAICVTPPSHQLICMPPVFSVKTGKYGLSTIMLL